PRWSVARGAYADVSVGTPGQRGTTADRGRGTRPGRFDVIGFPAHERSSRSRSSTARYFVLAAAALVLVGCNGGTVDRHALTNDAAGDRTNCPRAGPAGSAARRDARAAPGPSGRPSGRHVRPAGAGQDRALRVSKVLP